MSGEGRDEKQTNSVEEIIAWVNETAVGRKAYDEFNPEGPSVEDFLSDEVYVEKFLSLFVRSVGYPGDGKWSEGGDETDAEWRERVRRDVEDKFGPVPDDLHPVGTPGW